MTPLDEDADAKEVVHMALDALRAAQQRAMASGRDIVMVENGELVRIGPSGRTVLRKMPPRRKVTERVIRISQSK